MKKTFYILSLISLMCMIYICPMQYSYAIEDFNNLSNASSSNESSNNSWEIVIDKNKDSNEFEGIQNDVASSDLADNGYFLLLIGTILIILSIIGTIYFSVQLYKTCKLGKNKNIPKTHKNSHYVGHRYK